jgi:outer membrane protein OmpA-like peptidoglycan-associated protein
MTRHNKTLLIALLVVIALAVTACAGYPNRRAKLGGGAGTVIGALIGSQLGDKSTTNALIGAGIGTLAGAGVGHYMDRQQQELEKKLSEQRAAKELNITRIGHNALKVGIASDASFAIDSAQLSPHAQSTFNTIANVMQEFNKTAIHVVGFTDSTGTAQHNLQLSQQRADSVARFLEGRGVNSKRVLTWARGETQPVASNATKAGRAQNRRVAIIIKPIVKGDEKAAFSEPPNLGNPEYAHG